jgi:hypothetical protein
MRSASVLYFAFILLMHLLAGCALNQSFSGRVAAGYAAVATTNDTALVLVNAGTISKEDGRAVLEKTRAVRQAIDVANSTQSSDALTNALALLKAAQAELCKGQESNPNCALLQQGATP